MQSRLAINWPKINILKKLYLPCLDLFDQQSKSYKEKILHESKKIISIEAGSTDCWKKYIGTNGLAFGMNDFGKSAPYKDIYKYFGLTASNIAKKSKKFMKN